MKAKYLLMLLIVLLSLTTLVYAQQPAGAKAWFTPQKAISYNITENFSIMMIPDPVDPIIVGTPQVITTNYSFDPPLKFYADTADAKRIIQFRVNLTYDSGKLTIDPANFSTTIVGMVIEATVIQPGEMRVEGLTMMDAASPLNADKSLFQINLPPQAIPADPVIITATIEDLVIDSATPVLKGESAAVTVKSVNKILNVAVSVGDENNDGVINLNDVLEKARKLQQNLTPAGTVLAYSLGDADQDGAVTILDALAITRSIVGFTGIKNYRAADVDFSGSFNMNDALLVARFSAGLIDNF